MTDRYVIRNAGSLFDREHIGQFLMSYDPDAMDGFGVATWTEDVAQAMHFDTSLDALKCWRQASTVRPERDDGRPNRPLTAYSIEPVPLDGEGQPRWPSLFHREEP